MSKAKCDAQWSLKWVSERHLRIGCGIAPVGFIPSIIRRIVISLSRMRSENLLPGAISITPAFDSVLIEFDVRSIQANQVIELIRLSLAFVESGTDEPSNNTLVEIPVCYHATCGSDIQEVAEFHNFPIEELAHRHTSAAYSVRFIGFAPGFAYLDGLPSDLATPRLPSPRVRVPSGSVGIAGGQTGIYPFETAGGWRLIGRTPLTMFDASRERPALLEPGNRVRFVAISLAEFKARQRGEDA
jgi:inhibitor of KinA